jgi:hypothetical protein
LQPVHAGVFPFDADRAVISDGGEHPETVLPVDVAAAGGHEVPAAAGIGPRQVGAENTAPAVMWSDLGVLAVDVVDPVAEVPDEIRRVDVLPDHVRRVPVDAESLAVADCFQGMVGRVVVVGDLRRMYLVCETDPDLVENVQDRVPPIRKVPISGVDHLGGGRWEHRDVFPNR